MDNTVVVFDMDRCHMELNCPYFIQKMTLANLKKVFDLMCKQSWRNPEAIATTERYIQLCIEEARQEWHEASVKYQNEWVDVKFHYEWTQNQKQCAERENKKLINAVKSKKRAHDRLLKIQTVFSEIKNKYSV